MFFHASRDGDTRDMVDVTGRAYSKLPTAFLYRKSTIEGCKCKPEPWAQSELDRHRLYALTEASERQRIETATAAAPAEKAAPGTSDKAVAAKFAQLATGGKSPVEKVPTENTTAPPVRVVVAELTLPSDPAVAANQSAGAGDGPEPSKPDLAPAAIAPPVLAPLPADVPAHRTPSSRVVATPEADVPKPRRTERPARQEKAERAERRSVSAEPNRPRVAQARPQAPKPSGAFGLGAGSKSARWPGE